MSTHVLVQIDDQRVSLAYAWPGGEPLAVGDRVELPPPYWWPDKELVPCEGTVTALDTDYSGPVRAIIRRIGMGGN